MFRRKEASSRVPCRRESEVSAAEAKKDARVIYSPEDVRDFVLLSDGCAWTYIDGGRTMLYFLGKDRVDGREPLVEERYSLDIPGPSIFKEMARDAVELASVDAGMDADMSASVAAEFSKVRRVTVDRGRLRIRLNQGFGVNADLKVPDVFFYEVLGMIRERCPGAEFNLRGRHGR